MPKTKLQNFIFSLFMVIVMVYGMVCYNIAIGMGGMNNVVFLAALEELPIMVPIALLVELLVVGKAAKRLTFKLLDPKKTAPIFVTVLMSALMVWMMCPIMSLIGSLIFNFSGIENVISTWLQTYILAFPMALFWQLFIAGPFVRFAFGKVTKMIEARK